MPRCPGENDPSVGPATDEPEAKAGSDDMPVSLRLFADYVLIEEMARGGMGGVFKSRQISLDRIAVPRGASREGA